MELSVVIVTLGRPDSLRRCVDSLSSQAEVGEVIVVDQTAEPADLTGILRCELVYLHVPALAGQMTAARNHGLQRARGRVVSFLDDDVTVHDGWAAALLGAFREPGVVAVAGRAVDVGYPPAVGPVGVIRRGQIIGNFSAEAPPQEVDHGLGANMSFDRGTLLNLGGFRAIFPGTALREDTDVFLRISRRGSVRFEPAALVDHHAAPHQVGQRFDRRYMWWSKHNQVLLMIGNRELRRDLLVWLTGDLAHTTRLPASLPRRLVRLTLAVIAVLHGFVSAARLGVRGKLREQGPLTRSHSAGGPHAERDGHVGVGRPSE